MCAHFSGMVRSSRPPPSPGYLSRPNIVDSYCKVTRGALRLSPYEPHTPPPSQTLGCNDSRKVEIKRIVTAYRLSHTARPCQDTPETTPQENLLPSCKVSTEGKKNNPTLSSYCVDWFPRIGRLIAQILRSPSGDSSLHSVNLGAPASERESCAQLRNTGRNAPPA